MPNRPFFSIITVVYNCEKYLRRCIESVMHQTYENIELVLVDDGSSDDSVNICKEYSADSDNIVFKRHDVNKGQTRTRNDGLKCASGDWVTFLDSDDAMELNTIEELVGFAKMYPADFLITGYKVIYGDSTEEQHFAKVKDGVYSRKEIAQKIYDDIPLDILSCVGSKLYSGKFIRDIKPETSAAIKTNYDMAFAVDSLLAAEKISYVNYLGYSYFIREGSITYSYRNNMYQSFNDARSKLKQLFKETGLYEYKKLYYHRMRYGIITGSLSQEIVFGKGYIGFKDTFTEIIEDKDNDETFDIILKEDYSVRHKVLVLFIKYRLTGLTYFFTKLLYRRKV